jgi:hypothetical protein
MEIGDEQGAFDDKRLTMDDIGLVCDVDRPLFVDCRHSLISNPGMCKFETMCGFRHRLLKRSLQRKLSKPRRAVLRDGGITVISTFTNLHSPISMIAVSIIFMCNREWRRFRHDRSEN